LAYTTTTCSHDILHKNALACWCNCAVLLGRKWLWISPCGLAFFAAARVALLCDHPKAPLAFLLMSFAAFACISCLPSSHNGTRPVSWWARRLSSLACARLVRSNVAQQRRPSLHHHKEGVSLLACHLRSALPCPRAYSTLTPRTQRTQTPPRMRSAFSCTVAWQALASARPAPSIPASHSLTPPSPSPILPAHLHRQPWLSTHRRLTWRRTTLASCGGVTRPPRPLPPSSPHIYTDNHGVRHTVA